MARFTETLSTGIVTDNVTGKEYKCEMRIDDDLLGVMNNLHEENQALKGQLETYDKGCHEIYKDKCKLEEDNKELREAMKRLMADMMMR